MINSMAFPLLLWLLFAVPKCHSLSLSSILSSNDESDEKDPDRPLMCYRGIKYFFGQEEIDDNVECTRNFIEKTAGLQKYCYKFTSSSGGTDFVKRGCSVTICTGLRTGCTRMEFEGVRGEMCCCGDTSYCNAAASTAPTFGVIGILIFFTAIFSLHFS